MYMSFNKTTKIKGLSPYMKKINTNISICELEESKNPLDNYLQTIFKVLSKENKPSTEKPLDLKDDELKKKKIEINNFEDLLVALKKEKYIPLLVELEKDLKIISFKSGEIKFDLIPGSNTEIISKLTNFLNGYTNIDWDLIHLENKDAKTLLELRKENEINLSNSINENNIVQEIMKNFPGSKISKSSLN